MATAFDAIPKLTAILAGLLSVLNADLGANDFSGTGRVVFGRFPTPPMIPFMAIDPLSVETDDDGPPVGEFENEASVFIEAWAAVTASTTTAGAAVGSPDLAHEIIGFLQNGHRDFDGDLRSLGLRRLNVRRVEFLNTEINNRKIAHVRMELMFTYTTLRGI